MTPPNVGELQRRVIALEDALADVRSLIEDYADIQDGDETSGPRPNKAMRATTIIDEVL